MEKMSELAETSASKLKALQRQTDLWRYLRESHDQWAADQLTNSWGRTLLEKDGGPNPNAIGEDGWPVLTVAVRNGCPKTALALLEAGANPAGTDREGRTALESGLEWRKKLEKDGCWEEAAEVGKALAALGRWLNDPVGGGLLRGKETRLQKAAREGDLERVETLLRAGAHPSAKGRESKSAFELAAWHGHGMAAELIREKAEGGKGKRARSWLEGPEEDSQGEERGASEGKGQEDLARIQSLYRDAMATWVSPGAGLREERREEEGAESEKSSGFAFPSGDWETEGPIERLRMAEERVAKAHRDLGEALGELERARRSLESEAGLETGAGRRKPKAG